MTATSTTSPPEQEEQYKDANNYYHNENYRGTIEAVDTTGANIVVESHIEGLSKEEGDNKIITETNTKATMDNLIPPVAAIIIIIIMAIIEAEVTWPWW